MYTGQYHGCHSQCVYVPVVWVPCPPACCERITVPRDLAADAKNSSAQALAGGSEQVSLSIEYLVETGASSPSVKVTTTSDGSTATWSDTTPAVGYHVQEGFLSVNPGTKISLDVNNLTARIRWCERICC